MTTPIICTLICVPLLAAEYLVVHSRGQARLRKAEKEAEARLAETRKAHEEALAAERRHSDRRVEDLSRIHKESLAMIKDSVRADTEHLLRQRSDELQQSNAMQMDSIFRPLRENISRMEATLKQNREAQVSDTSRLKTVMEAMMSRTAEIGRQADELSSALRSQNKTMGNWGELILTQLLESQGLREGVHFDAQKALRDDRGELVLGQESQRRLIPDVILHLTNQREVVIDAKVSLKDFVDYQNATTEAERARLAQEHLRSMKSHVKELAAKDYSRHIPKPRLACDFVIMFVPNEGALQLMMATEPTFWDEAFNRHRVFIAGGQTLVAALHIIELTWRQELQERNTQSIIDEAQKLVDRIADFMARYRKVGESLAKVQSAYAEAEAKALTGSQSVYSTALRLTTLGVKGKKPLPHPTED